LVNSLDKWADPKQTKHKRFPIRLHFGHDRDALEWLDGEKNLLRFK